MYQVNHKHCKMESRFEKLMVYGFSSVSIWRPSVQQAPFFLFSLFFICGVSNDRPRIIIFDVMNEFYCNPSVEFRWCCCSCLSRLLFVVSKSKGLQLAKLWCHCSWRIQNHCFHTYCPSAPWTALLLNTSFMTIDHFIRSKGLIDVTERIKDAWQVGEDQWNELIS